MLELVKSIATRNLVLEPLNIVSRLNIGLLKDLRVKELLPSFKRVQKSTLNEDLYV